jgi:hypothetical protein
MKTDYPFLGQGRIKDKSMKTKKKTDWFDSHVIIAGPGLSGKDKEFIKDTIKKKCAKPIAKLDKDAAKNLPTGE